MCLILFSLNTHPNYKLIVAANRDEFYKRKTTPAAYWDGHPDLLGGRDLEAMGTWMGITRSGKIGMVTNYRDLRNIKRGAPSRGHLVADYLNGGATPGDYMKNLGKNASDYNGFNLLVGDHSALWYFSNYADGVVKISEGTHGISNHLMDTPWPKVTRGKQQFETLLQEPSLTPESLLDLLYDDQVADDTELPDTGVGLVRERTLSSMFIKSPDYGSRCSTVALVDRNDHVVYAERTYAPGTFDHQTRKFEFKIQADPVKQ